MDRRCLANIWWRGDINIGPKTNIGLDRSHLCFGKSFAEHYGVTHHAWPWGGNIRLTCALAPPGHLKLLALLAVRNLIGMRQTEGSSHLLRFILKGASPFSKCFPRAASQMDVWCKSTWSRHFPSGMPRYIRAYVADIAHVCVYIHVHSAACVFKIGRKKGCFGFCSIGSI